MKQVCVTLLLLACAHTSFGQLEGPLSGTLGPGEFHVVDTIYVNEGDSLTLMAGTTFRFDWAPFLIYGTLLAEGTEADSIIFTVTVDSIPYRMWGGLLFHQSGSSGSQLSYCLIEHASNWDGGGVRCNQSSPTFTNCTISENRAYGYGGGVYCYNNSSPTFANCIISNNSATGEWFWGSGGGAYCSHSSPTFVDCSIRDNGAIWSGGVECNRSSLTFTNCVISGNRVWAGHVSGVICSNCSGTFTNCTIIGNYGGGVFFYNSPVVFNSSVIAFSSGRGIQFRSSEETRVQYCDFFGNSGGDIVFWFDDPSNAPPGIGELATTNANGDSCDTYYNIFLDPMFVDTGAGDFHLTGGSPCIDAGDPELPLDPDSTIADIGAFYFDQLDVTLPTAPLPIAYVLHQNWPNPFNSQAMIQYDVKRPGQIRLTIFNLLGQKVTTLVDRRHLAGSFAATWDATGLPSGIYLCRLQAGDFVTTKKMVLLK